MKPRVRQQDADEIDSGEVMAFGHHLGSHEDVVFAAGEGAKRLLEQLVVSYGVPVETQNPRIRKTPRDLSHHLLRANPAVSQLF